MVERMRHPVCLLLVLGAFCFGCQEKFQAQARARPRVEQGPPYALGPLIQTLRPGVEVEVRTQLDLKYLHDLPLYDLELRLWPDQAKLDGRLTLYLNNRTARPIHSLPFLLHPNTPRELGGPTDSAHLVVSSARSLEGAAVARVHVRRPTLTEVELRRPLQPNERLKLELRFSSSLKRLPPGSNDIFGQALSSLGMSGAGLSASDYGLLAMGDGIITAASAYPMLAPLRAGRFDTSKPTRFGDLAYNDLAHFQARITVPASTLVVTNMQDAAPEHRDTEGTWVYTVRGAANRDLVLVCGRDLRQESRMLGDILVRSTYLASDEIRGKRLLDTLVGSLDFFQGRFGPYPYRELDGAEATLVGGAGGVEFPGLVLMAGMLYRSPDRSSSPLGQLFKLMGGLGSLLQGGLDDGASPGGAQGMLALDAMLGEMAAFTTAHEVAHQYFAGLVGSDCRAEPAVDEPLAQFAAGEYMRSVRGAAEGDRLLATNAKLNYGLYRLLGGKDRPVAGPVQSYRSPVAYAALVYGKAPYFYVALRNALGEERLRQVLRRAVDRYRYQLVTLEGWLKALADGAGPSASEVRRLARRWFYEAHGDADLGVDDSGDLLLGTLLGQEGLDQLKQSMGVLGMTPRDLFRMLMGNMMTGEL